MKKQPTYTAAEIRAMCLKLDIDSYRILVQVIDEELDLYDSEEIAELCHVSMMIFTRTLLMGSIKNLDK